ncbi:MAG: hypothetical protein RQ715_07575 [Methylococcales bacterium]|nr:hypothetical protein [Methylococcales bacterium]
MPTHTATARWLSLAAAGKLALTTNAASAQGLGKIDAPDSTSLSAEPLSLDQVGFPMSILTPPFDISNVGSKASGINSQDGTLFSQDVASAQNSGLSPRIDFVISNINNQNDPVVVFLAYSPELGNPSQWQDLGLDIDLDRNSIQIFAAFQIDAGASLQGLDATSPTTPLGSVIDAENSMRVSLALADLNTPELASNNLYFQSVAVPLLDGQPRFDLAQTSELDHYVINHDNSNAQTTGSKIGQASSKADDPADGKAASTTDNPTGGKFFAAPEDNTSSDNGGK